MRIQRIKIFALCITVLFAVIAFFTTSGVIAANDRSETTISQDEQTLVDLKNRLETASNNKNALIAALEKNKGQLHEYDERKQQIEINITYTKEEIQIINELSEKYNEILEQAEKDIVSQEVKLELAKNDFAAIVKYLYENGRISAWELILSSDDLSDFFAKYDYIDSLLEYNNELINEITTTNDKLLKTKSDYDDAVKALAEYKIELEEKQKLLEEEDKELEKLQKEYSGGVNRTKEQLDAAAKAEQDLLAEIKAMQQQIDDKQAAEESIRQSLEESRDEVSRQAAATATTAPAKLKISDFYTKTFTWPLTKSGKIITKFGAISDGQYSSNEKHNGIDISASKDTPIKAAAAGVVTRSEYSGVFGNIVVIDHGNGYSTMYCHCESRLVSVGANVLTDQIIAKVGKTGQASVYHLHFAVVKNGSYVDPELYLPKGYLT